MTAVVIKQGEAKTLTLTVRDGDGQGVDLSAADLLLGVKRHKTDAAYIFSKANGDFDKSQAAAGVVMVNLTPLDTGQSEGIYVGELSCSWTGPVINKSEDFFLKITQAVTG